MEAEEEDGAYGLANSASDAAGLPAGLAAAVVVVAPVVIVVVLGIMLRVRDTSSSAGAAAAVVVECECGSRDFRLRPGRACRPFSALTSRLMTPETAFAESERPAVSSG